MISRYPYALRDQHEEVSHHYASSNLAGAHEQRKTLVDDVALATKSADFAVPAAASVAAVLDERRRFRMRPGHLLQLSK